MKREFDTRLIVTSTGREYRIPRSEQGTPIEEHFGHVPEGMEGARVFNTDDGAIIAFLNEEAT